MTAEQQAPRTEAGRSLLSEWMLLRPDHPPNTARVRDLILAIEAEAARPLPEPQPDLSLNEERLADAISEAMNHVPWPGERGSVSFGGMTFAAAARAIAAEYVAALPDRPEPQRVLVPRHVPAMLDHDPDCKWVQSGGVDGCTCEARLPDRPEPALTRHHAIRLASMIVERPFTADEKWGEWPSLWERLASIHGKPGDSSRQEAADMLLHLFRLSQSEPALDRYESALNRIAGLGMDAPAFGPEPEDFYRDQLMTAIGVAARALSQPPVPATAHEETDK